MKWPEILTFNSGTDGFMRLLVVTVATIILVMYSTIFEVEYNSKLIELYMYPWWRILSVLLILAGSLWCPRVGILVALVIFMYLADINTLLTPFATTVRAS
jgi:hypothetical protein